MFSCGIIMFMLITGGEHPLYIHGDNTEVYKGKLRSIDEFWMHPSIQSLAKNLITSLTKFKPSQRYTI